MLGSEKQPRGEKERIVGREVDDDTVSEDKEEAGGFVVVVNDELGDWDGALALADGEVEADDDTDTVYSDDIDDDGAIEDEGDADDTNEDTTLESLEEDCELTTNVVELNVVGDELNEDDTGTVVLEEIGIITVLEDEGELDGGMESLPGVYFNRS